MAEQEPQYCAMEGSVHLVGLAEYTLCGTALEGAYSDDPNHSDPAMSVAAQRVTCEKCVDLIEYVKAVPSTYHRKRRRRTGAGSGNSVGGVASSFPH
jgi:hypothetical protein